MNRMCIERLGQYVWAAVLHDTLIQVIKRLTFKELCIKDIQSVETSLKLKCEDVCSSPE